MADQFQHISGVAVKVLARLAARKAVKEQLHRNTIPHRQASCIGNPISAFGTSGHRCACPENVRS